MMDYFAYLIANKTSFSKTFKIRKVYINEDPSKEETQFCPSCMARNHSSEVRYMYVNLHEAIYKCEAPNCMYPFQNFKFKNYTDNTIYYYLSAQEETPALDDFLSTFTNVALQPGQCADERSSSMHDTAIMDFSMHCFSPDRSNSSFNKSSGDADTSLNIFDSPTLSYKNLVQDFDTGFIDDILLDLNQKSLEKPKPAVVVSPVRVVEAKSASTNRQLKRCLQMFKETSTLSGEATFKVPPLPGSSVRSPAKIKPKKHSPPRRSKSGRRSHLTSSGSGSGSSPEKSAKKRKIKPYEKSNPPGQPKFPGVKPLANQKVEKMLNFIERSMKNRHSKPVETASPPLPAFPKHSAQSDTSRSSRRVYKRQSLSEAVLHDSHFDYSTSESELEDMQEGSLPLLKSAHEVTAQLQVPCHQQQSGSGDSDRSLPSFEDLLLHIHPDEANVQHSSRKAAPLFGYHSSDGAGSSSPISTRNPQWVQTPPKGSIPVLESGGIDG